MAQELTSRRERIRAVLAAAFSPVELEIVDESHLHEGHAGSRPGGETHYSIRIRAEKFSGLSRLAKHRLINEALAAEFASGLHALSIRAD
jgi:BolA protein